MPEEYRGLEKGKDDNLVGVCNWTRSCSDEGCPNDSLSAPMQSDQIIDMKVWVVEYVKGELPPVGDK